jgi:hypothetical protein
MAALFVVFARYENNHIEGDEWHADGRWEVNIICQKCWRNELTWKGNAGDIKKIGYESVEPI